MVDFPFILTRFAFANLPENSEVTAMSIAAMTRLARTLAEPPVPAAPLQPRSGADEAAAGGTAAARTDNSQALLGKALETVSSFIPTEVVTLYVAGLGIVTPSGQHEKWVMFGAGIALTLLFVALNATGGKSHVPPHRVAVVFFFAAAAFAAWASALPSSPFDDLYRRASIWGGFAVIVLAGVLPVVAPRFGFSLPSKTSG